MDVSQVLQALVGILASAPQLGAEAGEAIAAVQRLWSIVVANATPSDTQLAQFDAALADAHRALQNS